jgi:flagellar protein FlgJ
MDTESARLVTDIAGLDRLKTQAREDPAAAAGEVAREFESLLVQMMVKSMRQASLGDGILDSQQSLFYRDMYDQQLTVHLADRGIGLADVIERQLGIGDGAGTALDSGRSLGDYLTAPVRRDVAVPAAAAASPVAATPIRAEEPALDSPRHFVEALLPWAEEAAAELGLEPEALLAQAALETGWGRSVIHGAGGSNSHNLFGIKADARWQGERATVSTLEYVDGVAVRGKDAFRAYASYQQSFADYVDFLRSHSRYDSALQSGADTRRYFESLQAAGYATDPAYADKIMRVLESDNMRSAVALTRGVAQGEASQINQASLARAGASRG